MKRLALFAIAFGFLFIGAGSVSAQDEISKGEFFGGFMHKRGEGDSANGFNVAGTYNFHRLLGVKGDFSWAKKSPTTLTTYMGGLQIKDNTKNESMIKPFAHVLVGAQRYSFEGVVAPPLSVDSPQGILVLSGSETGFSMAIGGGIDIKVSDRVSVRAFQYDYNPVWLDNLGGRQDLNRFSFGIVIH